MKRKMFKRIAVLLCIMTLFIAPTTAYAASDPVLTFNEDGLTAYDFDPSPYFLEGGTTYVFDNTTSTNKQWFVPAGKTLDFTCFFNEDSATARFVVFKSGKGPVYDEIITSSIHGFIVKLPAESKDANYSIVMITLSNINSKGYAVYIE